MVDIQEVEPELPSGAEWVDDDALFDQEIHNAFHVVLDLNGGEQEDMEVNQNEPMAEENENSDNEVSEEDIEVEDMSKEEEEDPSEAEGISGVSS